MLATWSGIILAARFGCVAENVSANRIQTTQDHPSTRLSSFERPSRWAPVGESVDPISGGSIHDQPSVCGIGSTAGIFLRIFERRFIIAPLSLAFLLVTMLSRPIPAENRCTSSWSCSHHHRTDPQTILLFGISLSDHHPQLPHWTRQRQNCQGMRSPPCSILLVRNLSVSC